MAKQCLFWVLVQSNGPNFCIKGCTDLKEGHVLLLQLIIMNSSPLHDHADDSAFVVQRVVQLLLLRALGGLGMVAANQFKDQNK